MRNTINASLVLAAMVASVVSAAPGIDARQPKHLVNGTAAKHSIIQLAGDEDHSGAVRPTIQQLAGDEDHSGAVRPTIQQLAGDEDHSGAVRPTIQVADRDVIANRTLLA